MEFLHMDNVRWVEACLETLGNQLNPGGVNEPARAGYIYLVMEMIESSNAAARRWAVSSLASLLIWDEYLYVEDVKPQYISALIAGLQDDDAQEGLAVQALQERGEAGLLSQHADALVARLKDDNQVVRRSALLVLAKLEPATLAPHAVYVAGILDDEDDALETFDCEGRAPALAQALKTLGKLEPATLAQHVGFVLERLEAPDYEDRDYHVRRQALDTIGKLEPATLAQYADAVVARLEDSDEEVRRLALRTLGKLEPAALAQYASAVVARIEDNHPRVRDEALVTLDKLEPAALAQHTNVVLERLENNHPRVRDRALRTLGKLEPAALAQHANVVLARLNDSDNRVKMAALLTLRMLPRFVTRQDRRQGRFVDGLDVDLGHEADVTLESALESARVTLESVHLEGLRSRLLGRLGWYRYRLRQRVRRLALYWYALPYRPSGPGHARDKKAWDQMSENPHQSMLHATKKTRRAEGTEDGKEKKSK